ncbi:MAG: hypothetical protein N3H84_00130 [Candidatus Caldarchaeum sp.]|nr:hypothetical protein [Candidatus Caldarchaeum sp.]
MALKNKMTRGRNRSPFPVKVEDIASLARLLSSRWDTIPHLLSFTKGEKIYLSYLQTIPYGRISLPVLFYVELLEKPKKYLVYTPLEKEETRFSDVPETGRYVSYPVLEAEQMPEIFQLSVVDSRRRKLPNPEVIRVKDLQSIMRLVSALTDEAFSPPVWCYRNNFEYEISTLYPVYEYYDSAALPLLYLTRIPEKPPAPFIAYSPSERDPLKFTDSVSDARYVYGRIVFVEKFPLEV